MIEVDPQLLAHTGARLREAVAVVSEAAARTGELAALADAAGHAAVGEALRTFLARWAHGLGCLVEDAGSLATMLTDAGRVYLAVETQAAAASGAAR